ncbi:MAG: antibiotic biosynthesis monooxygenase [Candidatus Thermoplasmatota archaeon]|nr:antibiotic biosynthesis monooxygenase [Candidatus Thermoplasmatota archaeon]MCL5731695.1 antibiotic biosynthesis monooxygenase [Candidatus Thermoplasmatota archaeon]
MIVVQNSIPVKDEYRDEFEKRFIGRDRSVDKFQGFIRNEILRPIKGENYIVMTYWRTMEDFKRWTESEEFRKSHSGINDSMFSGKNILTIHEVIDSTGK